MAGLQNRMQALTEEQRTELCELYRVGKTYDELAELFGCNRSTVGRILKEGKVERSPDAPKKTRPSAATGSQVKLFASRVKSILWRQDVTTEKKAYKEWSERVEWLSSKEGGGYTRSQAVIRASKEYPCLERLFGEYDVSEFDPNPESHPRIVHPRPEGILNFEEIVCHDVKQSYRDSLRWAIEAAGAKLRLNRLPETCPNDTAFYLFRQAIEEPKDFMQKISQMELKVDKEDEALQNSRRSSKRSVEEIDSYLEELEIEEERIRKDGKEERQEEIQEET